MSGQVDISKCFVWEHEFPRPLWSQIERWVEHQAEIFDEADVWTEATRRWIDKLGEALTDHYQVDESENFLLLSVYPCPKAKSLLQVAEDARETLLGLLPGVVAFARHGKGVLLLMPNQETYYRYLSVYYDEGHYGASAGVCVRSEYPHIVILGGGQRDLSSTIAHELTHFSLCHRALPQWIEEGMAQIFEHDIAGRRLLELDPTQATKHRQYWQRHGLDDFWNGPGFSSPGDLQELSYQLAEICLRHIISECRPRWFGFDRSGSARLVRFLQEACRDDCGASAAKEELGVTLGSVAAKFLGPGSWEPGGTGEL